MSLRPLRCDACGNPAPLVEQPVARCGACGGDVPVPADYLQAARLHQAAAAARAAAEPVFARLTRPSPASATAGLVLLAALPPVVTVAANLALPLEPQAALFGLLTLPALLPGAGLWLWASAAAATALPFREALAAAAPERLEGPPGCRSCGAPLTVEPGALAATCLYCGTDSLLEVLPLSDLSRALRASLTSLRDGARALRRRRVLLGLGVTGLLLLVGALSSALIVALLAAT